ncbi:Ig-like domain-containing protein, partial [Alteromonas sp. KUL106]|uniref:beta strand repeat-containing protein n=1 Tax=Alteromonas sp. KUL106 TaxID=2480799 RepID=UPI001914E15C
GEFTVNASVTDEAGNTASTQIFGAIDVTAPTISLNDPGINGDATPTLSGLTDAVPGSTITLTVTDSGGVIQTFTTTVLADGTFTVEVPNAVAEGTYNVTAEVTDAAGNTAQATTSGDYDSTSPSTTVNQPTTTNDTTPNISGETDAPPGSEVIIVVTDSEGNEQTIVTTVGADGTFNEDVPVELSEGEYTVDVTVTAPTGNSSTTTVTGEIDTTAPTLTLENPGSTGDTTPTLSGTTDLPEGSTVTLVVTDSAGNTQTINALVDANGSFSVDVPNALADGDFTVTATATDSAGNTANANTTGSVDSEAPLLTLDTQGATSDVTPTITGTTDVAPGTLVTITVVDANGNSQSFQAAVQADGTFSADVPSALAEGDFTVTATVSDTQGNTATANETNGSIDTQAPIVNVNPLDSGNDTTPVISGNTDLPEGAVVVITVTDSNGDTQTINALVDADGNFAAEVLSPLPEGDYSVEVTATDDAGNSTTATEDGGNIDITAPAAPTVNAGNGTEITGTAEAGSEVNVDVNGDGIPDFTVTADGDGNWSITLDTPIADGVIVTATATDAAGNIGNPASDTVDAAAPVVTFNDLTTNDATPALTGSVDDPTATVVVTINGADYTA